jgi:hypothetical protein
VMLAIVTSLIAGWWLQRAVRRGDAPRAEAGRDDAARSSPRARRPHVRQTEMQSAVVKV